MTTINGKTSDGYHTFDELYDHRITLFFALCAEVYSHSMLGVVWCSRLHSDGTSFDGWFVIGIGTEPGSQITYHAPLSRWNEIAPFTTIRDRAPEFDGHTSEDVLSRIAKVYGWERP